MCNSIGPQIGSELLARILSTPMTVTAPRVVVGIDRVMIPSLYQSTVYNEAKYRRLRLSCCNKLLTISQLPSSS